MTLPSTVQVTINEQDAALSSLNGEVVFCPATGEYDAAGNPVVCAITDAANQVIVNMTPVPVTLNRGAGSIALVPTDTAGLNPPGWMYLVTTKIPGIPDYEALYFIPSSPDPVDLSQLTPVTPGAATLPADSGTAEWPLTASAGSLQEWVLGLTGPGGAPYDITGATWEYVVRTSQGATGSPLISVTTTANAQGVLTVTSTAFVSQVQVTLYPAATAALEPGTLFQALWLNPGTSSALAVATGQLVISGIPQP